MRHIDKYLPPMVLILAVIITVVICKIFVK